MRYLNSARKFTWKRRLRNIQIGPLTDSLLTEFDLPTTKLFPICCDLGFHAKKVVCVLGFPLLVFSSLQSAPEELVLTVKTHERYAVVGVLKIRYKKDGLVRLEVSQLLLLIQTTSFFNNTSNKMAKSQVIHYIQIRKLLFKIKSHMPNCKFNIKNNLIFIVLFIEI